MGGKGYAVQTTEGCVSPVSPETFNQEMIGVDGGNVSSAGHDAKSAGSYVCVGVNYY